MSRRTLYFGAATLAVVFPLIALASPLAIPNGFEDDQMIVAAEFNENFDAIAEAVNDNDARIAALEAGGGIPSGTIAFFASVDAVTGGCPTGWDDYDDLRGRVALGVADPELLEDTVGSPLADGGTRTITSVPNHTHTAGGLSATTVEDGGHTHTMSGAGGHTHTLAMEADVGVFSNAFVVGGANTTGGSTSATAVSEVDDHVHPLGFVDDHQHGVTLTGSTGNNSNGAASVDVTMPYVLLLACRKV